MITTTDAATNEVLMTTDESLDDARDWAQRYANAHRISVEITVEGTGEVETIHPLDKRADAYPFERRGVLVRVHDDDRRMILDTAKALNEARRQQS